MYLISKESFTSIKRYKTVKLLHPSDVVELSSTVQNSISHLALEVSHSRRCRKCLFGLRWSPYSLIKTEEKCKKLHSSSRNLLFNLNLDLPRAREWSLQNQLIPKLLERSAGSPFPYRIEISDGFYFEIMRFLIHYVCTYPSSIDAHRREKVFKLFMKFDAFNCYDQVNMPPVVLQNLVDCMYVELTDSKFVEKCLKKFSFKNMLIDNDKPERVENLLYLVNQQGTKLDREVWRCEFSDRCLLHLSFAYVDQILKFSYAPHLCTNFIYLMSEDLLKIRSHHPISYISTSMPMKNERRWALLHHLYWTYFYKCVNPSAAAESLRLVWNAVPDSFISYTELDSIFTGVVFKEIDDIHDFYCEAVGEQYHEYYDSRSLQHLCRYTIRKMIWKSNQWIPEAIQKLPIPKKIMSYLKLET